MSIDVRQIKLDLRYPESRQEDITDAYMRGYMGAVEIGNRAIGKLESERDILREIICDLWPRAAFTMSEPNVESWTERLHDAGIDVEYDGGGY